MAPAAPIVAGVWPKSSVKDVAESIGMLNLSDDAASSLAADVEFRLHQIIEESMKFMRHSKRTKLKVEDVDNALRVRNIEPLWGFASTDTLAFRRTTSAAGNLYFVDDDEIDLSRIVSAQLPPVPREVSYTAHWLAVEGIQPAIPQNPTPSELKNHPGFASTHTSTSAHSGTSASSVKHHLSRELQLYFDRVTSAAFDDLDDRSKTAGLASLSGDPGLHQVVPYLVQFAAEKVTNCLASPIGSATDGLSVLQTIQYALAFLQAILSNPHLFLEPYLQQLLPTILTCLLSTSFSSSPSISALEEESDNRQHAASLLASILAKYGPSYPGLKPRVLKTLLRALIERRSPGESGAGSRWGAILTLRSMGAEATRKLLAVNVLAVGEALEADERTGDFDRVQKTVAEGVSTLAKFATSTLAVPAQEDLEEHVGQVFAARLMSLESEEAARAFHFIRHAGDESETTVEVGGGEGEERHEALGAEEAARAVGMVDPLGEGEGLMAEQGNENMEVSPAAEATVRVE